MRGELVVMGWLLVLGVAFAHADAAAQAGRSERLATNLASASSTLQIGLGTAEDDTADTPPLFPAPDPFADLEARASGAPLPPPQQPVAEPAPAAWKQSGPPAYAASEILSSAQALLGIPYVWGGNTTAGMDCSAWVSKTWGLSRQTTDTLYLYSKPISKDELLPGDAMNLTTRQDPRGYGHIRLFAAWANEEHSRVWVFEETPRQSIYHVIAYDDRYQPIRRTNFTSAVTVAPLIPAPTPTPRPQQAAPTATSTSRQSASRASNGSRDRDELASLLTKATPTSTAAAAQDLRSTTVVVTVVPRYIPTPTQVQRTPTPLPWREPTPFPTPRITNTPTPSPTATPRSTSTPTPTATARPTVTATATPAPTAAATAAPTASATPKPTSTPTSTSTPTATATATPTATSTALRRRFR